MADQAFNANFWQVMTQPIDDVERVRLERIALCYGRRHFQQRARQQLSKAGRAG